MSAMERRKATDPGDPAEDALLRAWARIVREAAEADRSARPVLRVVGARRPRRANSQIRAK
jgi:hypothetical protein